MDEIITRFNDFSIRYLLIGGQALRLEGLPRFTMDWDFFIPPKDLDNFSLINEVLDEYLDLPLLPLGPRGENFIQTYQTEFGVLQFHLGGPGFPSFKEAESRLVYHYTESGTKVACLSGKDLLISKKRANRPQDQLDILFLEKKLQKGLL